MTDKNNALEQKT